MTLNKKPWDFGKDMSILTLDISFSSLAKKTVFWDKIPSEMCERKNFFLRFLSFSGP